MTGLATNRSDGVPMLSMKSAIFETLSKESVKMVV